uniref:CSON011042 protein n=1 Tax=Culicoides sonorensis TaxID=179676 RepID=A0A336KH95_CULSO
MSTETQRVTSNKEISGGVGGNSSISSTSSASKPQHNSQPVATTGNSSATRQQPQSLSLRHVLSAAASSSASGSTSNQQHAPTTTAKTDEIEVQVTGQKANGTNNNNNNTTKSDLKSGRSIGWIVCAPCIFLRTSTTFKKMALTTLTLLVTSLLVASPILFLTQFALPARDCTRNHCIPPPKFVSSPECQDVLCRNAANTIQARMNWKSEACNDFYSYCCSNSAVNTVRAVKSAQERTDSEMQMLLMQNTTSGMFRKLGRLYGSCLRQNFNATSIRLLLDELGGYMPIGAIGPHTLSTILSRINSYGYNGLFDVFFDLTYGRKPHIIMVIDVANANPSVLQRKIRWNTMKPGRFIHATYDERIANEVIDNFIPIGLSRDIASREKQTILTFIDELMEIRYNYMSPDYSNDPNVYNISTINKAYRNINFTEFVTQLNWTGPIVVRNEEYLKQLDKLIAGHAKRVIHNALLILFAINALPQGPPNAYTCTKAVEWAMPEATSALYVNQFSPEQLENAMQRADIIFESIKAHLKRSPSLRGAALVRLSALKLQGETWPMLYNQTYIREWIDSVDISSDNWMENVMRIYKKRNEFNGFNDENITSDSQIAWAYPTIARPFFDPLSQSIIMPTSLLVHPYFDPILPPYLHYATVGVPIAQEILRSVSRKFEDKLRKCVPNSIDDYPKYTRQNILVYSGALQMSFHALLHQTGRGSASKSFSCTSDTRIYKEKTCDIW